MKTGSGWKRAETGLPDFSFYNIPKRGKLTKLPTNIPNDHNMFHLAEKFTKQPFNIPTSSIASPSKIYPDWDFGFEKIPSGNPGQKAYEQGDQMRLNKRSKCSPTHFCKI
jgi:hypothetical protein